MPEARIARYATCVEDVADLPADTIIVSATGVVLRRTSIQRCSVAPCWFDNCPGCDHWRTLDEVEHLVVSYGTDQLFAERGSRELTRAFCDIQRDRAPYHHAFAVPELTPPFLIAYEPPVDLPSSQGVVA